MAFTHHTGYGTNRQLHPITLMSSIVKKISSLHLLLPRKQLLRPVPLIHHLPCRRPQHRLILKNRITEPYKIAVIWIRHICGAPCESSFLPSFWREDCKRQTTRCDTWSVRCRRNGPRNGTGTRRLKATERRVGCRVLLFLLSKEAETFPFIVRECCGEISSYCLTNRVELVNSEPVGSAEDRKDCYAVTQPLNLYISLPVYSYTHDSYFRCCELGAVG